MPKITIITVVYNAEELIEETVKSVINQTYFDHAEYIVIDGNSKDQTLNIISKYKDKIDTLVSEPDNGIYDAMNKAIELANGEWINFMNAGDTFVSLNVLEKAFMDNKDIENYDVIYGNNYYKGKTFCKEQVPRKLAEFYRGMIFNHQSAFVKTGVMKKFKFDLNWKIQCEYDLLYKLYLNNYKFKHIPEFIAIYSDGGFSEQNNVERTLERWLINKRHKVSNPLVDTHYLNLLLKFTNYNSKIIKNNQKQEIIQRKNEDLTKVLMQIKKLANTSIKLHPYKKLKEYKKLISLVQEIKKDKE